tara:strand:- start:1933 stop:2109 length:177 start_codon:yes stop_codon:yes gene_type:complete
MLLRGPTPDRYWDRRRRRYALVHRLGIGILGLALVTVGCIAATASDRRDSSFLETGAR